MNLEFPFVKLLGQRLFIAVFFAFLCRFLFLIFNPGFYSFEFMALVQAFFYGFLYDFSSLIYINSLFILLHLLPSKWQKQKLFQQLLFALFFVLNGSSIILNLIDIAYFPFSGKRSGFELFEMRKEVPQVAKAYLLDYWYLFFLLFFLLFLLFRLYLFTYKKAIHLPLNKPRPNLFSQIILMLLIAGLSFIGARGSIGLLPLNTFDAARQTRPELVPLVVNTPFNLIMSTQQSGLQKLNYLPPSLTQQYFNPVQQFVETQNIRGNHPNIVLIIVESLGKEYVSYFNKPGYTPFLDSLMSYSTVFYHAYANGKKSVEGIPSILASIPSWLNTPYLSSYYQGNRIKSAGSYLKEIGYNSSFYHGGRNGTMSFDNFIALSDGGAYFGLNEYKNEADFDGNWGVYDEPYLQYFAKELGQKQVPFFSTLFTLSSHHPYSLPKAYQNKFPKGTLPIHQTIAYADYSLRQFFVTAQKQAWYSNTIFIITADHSAENQTGYYLSPQGKFEIPLLIFNPSKPEPQIIEKTVSQLDIMPLILTKAGYPKPWFSFGNYFNQAPNNKNGVALQYSDQYFQLIQYPYVYQFDGYKELGFYNIKQDSWMNINLLKTGKIFPEKLYMDSLLKSIIQEYNSDLISNKTLVRP